MSLLRDLLPSGGTASVAADDGLARDDKAVVVDALVKEYGDETAVGGVTFEVDRGEIFTIVGPNGAGKTTTVEMIEGIRTPTSGTVEVLGHRLPSEGASLHQDIGVLPQELQLIDRLTVGEAVDYFRGLYRDPLPAEEILEVAGLEGYEDTQFQNLSGGYKRRVGIGSALAGDPEIVFLDEPTAGLDPMARRSLWDLVRSLQGEGTTVVLTTHYMDEAERLSDRVAILHDGEILDIGAPDRLVAKHGGETSLRIAGLDDDAPAQARKLGEDLKISSEGALVIPVDSFDELGGLIDRVHEAGLPLGETTIQRPSLDDVFVKLVSEARGDPDGGEPP